MKNLCVYGTRPEEIKLYPFTKYKDFDFLEVDQSKDLHQNLINPQYKCEENELKEFIKKLNYDRIIVQGDTRTAFYAALYGYENKRSIVHVEAGLRTHDIYDPHPEEGYRAMIDQIAEYKFCSTPESVQNCDGVYVGQTSIDTLFEFAGEIKDGDYYIVTVHRTNIDKAKPIIDKYIDNIIVFAHPNKIGQELKKHYSTRQPYNYKDFVKLLAKSKGCISDSGGLQEECAALNKEFITLRNKTERGHGEEYYQGATNKIIKYLEQKNKYYESISIRG